MNFDSVAEEIMASTLDEILREYPSLSYVSHVRVREILNIAQSQYSEIEFKYLNHPWTHVDFLVFNRFDKSPVIAIEVDGIRYHEQSKKQSEHDSIKDGAFAHSGVPLLRLRTNESNEKARIIDAIKKSINK